MRLLIKEGRVPERVAAKESESQKVSGRYAKTGGRLAAPRFLRPLIDY